jgi:D-alanine-D-alanine ligase
LAKLRVGILFGGKSAEHEVSIQSARHVVAALDPEKYETVLVGIDRKGTWFLDERCRDLLEGDVTTSVPEGEESVALVAESGKGQLIRTRSQAADRSDLQGVDVVFPVLHGPYGEDGSLQGLLKQANVPYVGAGVLGSAVGMDKDVMKRLLRDAGIPGPGFVTIHRSRRSVARYREITDELGSPVFVKPANLGSSVGISKAADETAFEKALDEAFEYDDKVIIEEAIPGREIECSVLGNEDPIASVPGEVVPHHEFYSYEAKYLDENGAALIVPADLPDGLVTKVQELAIRAFQTLCCEGMARADFFLREDGELFVNEINTIPGFTRISMYPKLWEASGLPPTKLVDRLIELAIERHGREQKLKTNR